MSDESERNQGLREAHTPAENFAEADPDRAAKVGSVRATAEAAMGDLAQQLASAEAEPEQQSLMLDEIDEQQSLFAGPVRHVAETIANARTGRGRPKGSQNKASRQFAETLMRMGYRHPGLNLAALANADPAALAIELGALPSPPAGVSPHEWLSNIVLANGVKRDTVIGLLDAAQGLILKANAELLPYFESKAPTKLELEERIMGVMMIGEMKATPPADGQFMSLTRTEKPE
ncbi:Hypothetical protein NGAL_HAMBI2605_59220 [Neorhizobium galegae bv. orientalis]|nr:Hypothetical protein NGAL_HAMBI2605_59220 [Neorhizobium galegae bv. orientalis]